MLFTDVDVVTILNKLKEFICFVFGVFNHDNGATLAVHDSIIVP